ncbi:MAG: hypothetical protein M3N43_13415 [Actinomycetota bacterium]|nr:hypothetical protein [Actinomycetota bacterium]
MSECRDPQTAGQWRAHTSICQAGVVIEATQDNLAEEKKRQRGLHIFATRSTN